MEKEIDGFVGVYKNAFTEEFCKETIREYEELIKLGFGWTRKGDAEKTSKDDFSFFTGSMLDPEKSNADSEIYLHGLAEQLGNIFTEAFWGECYPHYAENFAVLKNSDPHTIYGNKIQRTKVGQGYHVWHYESSSRPMSNRLLTYIVYLNDVEEGGETEFLYQSKRYKPEQGTCVIFPAAFTHTHRGNPPISNTKYILTGWVEF